MPCSHAFRWAVRRVCQALLAETEDARVLGDQTRPVVDGDLVFRLAHLELATDESPGHREDVAIDVDEAFDVHHAVMQQVDVGHPRRARHQMGLLFREEFERTGLQRASLFAVDALAPRTRLEIEVREVGEGSTGDKVSLDVVEAALDVGRAIGVALFVRDEGETVAPGEGLHLGHRHHVGARALEDDDVCVVHHAPPSGAAEEGHRLIEKHLAGEAIEARVDLHETHSRVGQHHRRGLHAVLDAADVHHVRRGVVLHLLARLEDVPPGRLRRREADAVATAVASQRLVRKRRAHQQQLLVHAHQVALAPLVQLADVGLVRLGLLATLEPRHRRRACAHYPAHRAPREFHHARDGAHPDALVPQLKNGRPYSFIQHRPPPCAASRRGRSTQPPRQRPRAEAQR